jgi:hypothetical protein
LRCAALTSPLSVGDWAYAACRPAKIKHRSGERRFLSELPFFLSELPHSQAELSVIFRRSTETYLYRCTLSTLRVWSSDNEYGN